MEPDKFEEYIKKQLNSREINPSDNAWDKISGQLQKTESPKSKRFFWYSVAAAFIGVLIVSSIYFNSKIEPIDPQNQIVETADEPKVTPKKESVVLEQNTIEENVAVSQKEVNKTMELQQVKDETTTITNSKIAALEMNKGQKKEADSPKETEQLIAAKITELMAQVDLLESDNLSVSEEEVDSLLRMAQHEILTDKIFSQGGKVDAMALLNEVEGELDQTFREQIFKSLKARFLKVRTAVADRNN